VRHFAIEVDDNEATVAVLNFEHRLPATATLKSITGIVDTTNKKYPTTI
jgi:hypothetical protein